MRSFLLPRDAGRGVAAFGYQAPPVGRAVRRGGAFELGRPGKQDSNRHVSGESRTIQNEHHQQPRSATPRCGLIKTGISREVRNTSLGTA